MPEQIAPDGRSIQSKLFRVRPPRVHITYEVEIGDAIEVKELAFVVGVLADFTGQPEEPLPRLRDRKFVEINPDNFDDVVNAMRPRLAMNVENKLSDEYTDIKLAVELRFRSMDDFRPENVARQVKPLRELLELRVRLADLRGILLGNERLEELLYQSLRNSDSMSRIRGELAPGVDAEAAGAGDPLPLPPQAQDGTSAQVAPQRPIEEMWVRAGAPASEEMRQRGHHLLAGFFSEVLNGSITLSRDVEMMINARLAQIDRLLSIQLNEIMHQPDFQKLEATWRGVKYLLDQSQVGPTLKIRILNSSKRDMLRDLQRAPEFDQSSLFKKVYEEEFGIFGGNPYSVLVADYYFSRRPEDIELLEKLSNVAAASHAPLISSAAPDLFNLESFTSLNQPRDIAKIFDTTEYLKWKSFRQSEDARYVGLVVPRILLRAPYGHDSYPTDEFDYEESVEGGEHEKYLWGNGAYAFASRLTNAFERYGWTAAIRGVEGGGLVESLPSYSYASDDGDVIMKCPTEISITDRREKELADLGFIPLVYAKGTDYACFFSANSVQKTRIYDRDSASQAARFSAQLPYVFAISRFMHYLKAMMRDKIGSFMSRGQAEQYLNQWISNYVTMEDDAGMAVKAQYPLREAHIDVLEVPGKPGAYRAVAYLQPNFQLEPIGTSLRVVVDLPTAAR